MGIGGGMVGKGTSLLVDPAANSDAAAGKWRKMWRSGEEFEL
jgi:hypothetical protein